MSLEEGCGVIVDTCMGVREDDEAVIITDDYSEEIGKRLKNKIDRVTSQTKYFNLDDFGERPLEDIPDEIKNSAEEATVTFWTAKSVKGELNSIRMPFFKSAVVGGRHAHMVNITEEIIDKALSVDYKKVEQFTHYIKDRVEKADKVRIKTDKGTDLIADVRKYNWVASTGILRDSGDWHNLPDGEVFTAPHGLEGTAVIDGTIGDHFDDEYTVKEIQEANLKIHIENNKRPKLAGIESENEKLKEDLKRYLNEHENSKYIGELGIGTNIFLEEMVGNMLMDEKFPGAHIAFGDPNDPMTGAGWECPTHVDMIMKDCDIWFDDEKIMEEGDFLVDIG